VPEHASGTNISDANAHLIAGGAGIFVPLPLLFERPLRVDASWQTHLLAPARKEKSGAAPPGSWTLAGQVSELSVALGYMW
jgi:hypothetical protein